MEKTERKICRTSGAQNTMRLRRTWRQDEMGKSRPDSNSQRVSPRLLKGTTGCMSRVSEVVRVCPVFCVSHGTSIHFYSKTQVLGIHTHSLIVSCSEQILKHTDKGCCSTAYNFKDTLLFNLLSAIIYDFAIRFVIFHEKPHVKYNAMGEVNIPI